MVISRQSSSSGGLSPLVRGNPPSAAERARPGGTIPARAGEPPAPPRRRRPGRDYPRSCGGTPRGAASREEVAGLSPLVRGNPRIYSQPLESRGTIPARAGEPLRRCPARRGSRDYPRSCGGTLGRQAVSYIGLGLSPLVRGNPMKKRSLSDLSRTIPARAGEPSPPPRSPLLMEDYPRSCGGTDFRLSLLIHSYGLSPLVRGNRALSDIADVSQGTIPARAGEPCWPCSQTSGTRDYPRSCGGTPPGLPPVAPPAGLSPLVRGNPHPRRGSHLRKGTIPARAGEPLPRRPRMPGARDYPRSCGGTALSKASVCAFRGLSPLVRGNRACHDAARGHHGTIPARAGEPRRRPARPSWRRDYPRSCGGTSAGGRPGAPRSGLSPLVRGNPSGESNGIENQRTIPARAGEPGHRAGDGRGTGDYPRSCGGTIRRSIWRSSRGGLSPLVRGNRSRPNRRGAPNATRDYPRSCGGTDTPHPGSTHVGGLSPLVRGNPVGDMGMAVLPGTIPARAGEPRPAGDGAAGVRDYPRSCGGTPSASASRRPASGLSPLVRGNLWPETSARPPARTIPARAGEPAVGSALEYPAGDYPRSCGGTACSRPTRTPPSGLSPLVRGNRSPHGEAPQ